MWRLRTMEKWAELSKWERVWSSGSANVPDGARCLGLVFLCKSMFEHLFTAERLRICTADGHGRLHTSQRSRTTAGPHSLCGSGLCTNHTADMETLAPPTQLWHLPIFLRLKRKIFHCSHWGSSLSQDWGNSWSGNTSGWCGYMWALCLAEM